MSGAASARSSAVASRPKQ
ncbi:unnamed protein product, partial [Rotaria sp. Silwood1]